MPQVPADRGRKKLLVEDCLAIDIRQVVDRALTRGGRSAGVILLKRPGDQANKPLAVEYSIAEGPGDEVVYLEHFANGERLRYPVRLDGTQPNFGGIRLWFLCPATVDGRRCGQRTEKLYLPVAGKYFACRRCYGMTYLSTQRPYAKRSADLLRTVAAFVEGLESKEPLQRVAAFSGLRSLVAGYRRGPVRGG